MKIEISFYIIALIAVVPVILVFLTMTMQIKKLEHQKKQLETDALLNNANVLELEKEIVELRNGLTDNGVVQFSNNKNNNKEKAL